MPHAPVCTEKRRVKELKTASAIEKKPYSC
jgi:hypothetical protein